MREGMARKAPDGHAPGNSEDYGFPTPSEDFGDAGIGIDNAEGGGRGSREKPARPLSRPPPAYPVSFDAYLNKS